MTSSIYPQPITESTPTITAGNDILALDIPITNDLVKPGGGGILRLYFSFIFLSTPAVITVRNNAADKGTLNADNSNNIISNGYYRFDIDVEAGDNINLQSSIDVTGINLLRAHLVQFGA